MNEKALVIESGGSGGSDGNRGPLVGILHRAGDAPEIGVLMMVAGGPQYRIGGHRQLVLWARRLAASGFPTLRFDFAGMGDSYGEFRDFDDSEDDIRAAIDRLLREVPTLRRIVLWGECNACSAALFYAHQEPRIAGLVMLNPWVRTEQGKARAVVRHYYLRRLTERSFWAKVLRLKLDLVGSLRSAAQMIAQSHRRAAPDDRAGQTGRVGAPRRAAPAAGRSLPERMYAGLTRFKGRIMLIMSGRDLIASEFDDLLQASADWRRELAAHALVRHDLPYADHTFSTAAWRDQVGLWGIDWLSTLAAQGAQGAQQHAQQTSATEEAADATA